VYNLVSSIDQAGAPGVAAVWVIRRKRAPAGVQMMLVMFPVDVPSATVVQAVPSIDSCTW
jgi:hypothetical protein